MKLQLLSFTLLLLSTCSSLAHAGDWPRFRGPNGEGIYKDSQPLATEWSDSKNLAWKTELPGPGLSSPIVINGRVIVTCWSGYGTGKSGESIEDLKRHVVSIDRKTGKIVWDKSFKAVLPEETFRGMFAENGYASHTPVSDGENVYAYLGKNGVVALDWNGNLLWQKDVGTEDDNRGWGSASSPILYKDLVIVPATTESKTLYAFDKKSGSEHWKSPSSGFAGCWGTPAIVNYPDGKSDIVFAVPYEIWGFNPDNGKLRWYANGIDSDSYCSSVLVHGEKLFAIDGRSGSSLAIKAGGKGDVSKTNTLWSGTSRNRIGTPVFLDNKLFFVANGIVNCISAEDGTQVYQKRIERAPTGGFYSDNEPPAGGRPGGGRGGPGGQDYSSPVLGFNNTLYYTFRNGEVAVMQISPTFKQISLNKFNSDKSDFSATPALSNGDIFIRSNTNLYCISEK